MTAAASALQTLKEGRPEWTPWLAVVAEVCEQMTDSVWDATVPAPAPAAHPPVPLLTNATISLPSDVLRQSLARLIQRASESGGTKDTKDTKGTKDLIGGRSAAMATLDRLLGGEAELSVLFAAAVCQDRHVVQETAGRTGTDVEALHAVTALWCSPFLHACHRQWATVVPESWTTPYCPICASRPAFVEVRGIERTRYARCGRCGAEWYARMLQCFYCDNRDHEHLLTLVPQSGAPANAIEACTQCGGYIKTFMRLQGCSPGAVYIDDLASVELDLAALDAGYRRPHGAGYPLAVTVHAQPARRRLFPWPA